MYQLKLNVRYAKVLALAGHPKRHPLQQPPVRFQRRCWFCVPSSVTLVTPQQSMHSFDEGLVCCRSVTLHLQCVCTCSPKVYPCSGAAHAIGKLVDVRSCVQFLGLDEPVNDTPFQDFAVG